MYLGFATLYYAIPEAYLSAFSDPTVLVSSATQASNEEAVVKYYSTGDGNLTVEATVTEKSVDASEESAVSTKETIKYDNYLLKSASIEATSNKGNVSKMNFTFEAKAKFAITLPSGWEALINKTSAEEA